MTLDGQEPIGPSGGAAPMAASMAASSKSKPRPTAAARANRTRRGSVDDRVSASWPTTSLVA